MLPWLFGRLLYSLLHVGCSAEQQECVCVCVFCREVDVFFSILEFPSVTAKSRDEYKPASRKTTSTLNEKETK